ncbi:transcriptional regulator, LysR family [Anaeromyxobacter dehalogenans 2CP-1]|uniref:Transcriptional regulator, LysR family n=1 Tax=Anaeromyxobacter dehalogenans (strain ATCC BAA-258 / DSM 21875 / 2CP-1) TaxID=455488 RepID=B8J9Z0_ANAD2|nr:LysR substrate-binding domain-containing protein [Anaeromyxobacter dehalogenans]ACL63693.1 transcriptional regulator, LysR family [Anaeromyxobacter dehalogenans 2CP-1]
MAITRLPPHPFSLRQLQYAVAVAETLSFRRAAERCRVAQPSLSTQIAQLESALGLRLFERDRRRVLVTGAGRPLLEQMRRLLLQADDLLEAARRAGDPLAGALRVGVIPTISPYLLPAIAPALRAAYPALHLTWLEDRTAELVRSLHAGTLDAALLAVEAELGDVEVAPVARDAFVLATPPGHPLGVAREPASAAELRDASVLLLEDGHCLREQALAFCSRARTRELEFRATSLSTLAQMVAGGAGVTLLPELAVPTETRRADLRLRPFADPAPFRTVALVWRRSSPIAEALRRLAGTVKAAYPAPAGRAAGSERQRPRAPRA